MNKINLSLLGVATAAIAMWGCETLASTFTPVSFFTSVEKSSDPKNK